MSTADTSPQAVERLTHGCENYNSEWMVTHGYEIAATLRALLAERDAARAAQDAAIREVGNLGRRIGQLEAAMERISKVGLPRARVMAAAKNALEKKDAP